VNSSQESEEDFNGDDEERSDKESEEKDFVNDEFQSLSEEEEAPVLPKVIVKRKLDGQYGSKSGPAVIKGRSGKRSTKATLKKQRVTELDSSILKKLEFHKRPKNRVSFVVFVLVVIKGERECLFC